VITGDEPVTNENLHTYLDEHVITGDEAVTNENLHTYLDEHMFLAGQQVHVAVIHRDGKVNDVTQQVIVADYFLQRLLQRVAYLVLSGQEHREILRFLQCLWVGHHLQKLGSSVAGHTSQLISLAEIPSITHVRRLASWYASEHILSWTPNLETGRVLAGRTSGQGLF